jgi:hypothetical protein
VPASSLEEALVEVWRQALVEGVASVTLSTGTYPVMSTRSQGLKVVHFQQGDTSVEGIEQNPLKTSTWAKRASSGERIMQFKVGPRYIGNVAEGKLTRYPSWKAQGLPE